MRIVFQCYHCKEYTQTDMIAVKDGQLSYPPEGWTYCEINIPSEPVGGWNELERTRVTRQSLLSG